MGIISRKASTCGVERRSWHCGKIFCGSGDLGIGEDESGEYALEILQNAQSCG